jgi:hypothetical protein
LVVELGVVVVAVAAVEPLEDEEVSEELPEVDVVSCCDELAEVERLPEPVEAVELTVVSADAVVPGISFETTRPRTAAAAVATMATAPEVRRTLVRAMSRRLAPSCAGRPRGLVGGPVECPRGGGVVDDLLMHACHHANLATLAQPAMSRL